MLIPTCQCAHKDTANQGRFLPALLGWAGRNNMGRGGGTWAVSSPEVREKQNSSLKVDASNARPDVTKI